LPSLPSFGILDLPKPKPKEETGMDKERPKHGEKECPKDAWKRWKWIRYPGDEPHTESPEYREKRKAREYKAERETDRDLNKSIPQLVADFNKVVEHLLQDGHLRRREDDTIYLLTAQRRMVAMMAKVAIEHMKISRWMLVLTIAIFFLTAVMVPPAIVAWRDNFKKISNNSKVIENAVKEPNIRTDKETKKNLLHSDYSH
jgi:hypothetical protein